MTKKNVLKYVDTAVGKPLVLLVSKRIKHSKFTQRGINTILVVRPGGIGDAVLLIPALSVLRESFPHAAIDILAERRNAGVFGMIPGLGRIYQYDRNFDLVSTIRNNYDLVIDTEQWHRLSAVAAFLVGAPLRAGFATNERQRLFTHKVPYSHDDYEIRSYWVSPLL